MTLELVRPADRRRRRVPSPRHICPHFVKSAVQCDEGGPNPAELLNSLLRPQKRSGQPSSSRKRIELSHM